MNALRQFLGQERGRCGQLASDLGITPSALSQWQKVPPLRVLEVERITGIPRHELRPDLYPTPEQERVA